MRKVVGITGLQSSGKDTIGDILQETGKWKKMSFADHLKDVCALLFGWDREMLAGITPENRAKREVPDEFWSQKLGKDFTPRMALQEMGTNLFRNQFYKDMWVACLEKKLLSYDGNVVITDVRFPNEIEMLERIGGEVWRVERGELPNWFRKVESFQKDGTDNLMYDIPYYVPEIKSVHESEWRWVGVDKPKAIFYNNGTIEELKQDVLNTLNVRENFWNYQTSKVKIVFKETGREVWLDTYIDENGVKRFIDRIQDETINWNQLYVDWQNGILTTSQYVLGVLSSGVSVHYAYETFADDLNHNIIEIYEDDLEEL